MRVMQQIDKRFKAKLKIRKHLIARNFWEYYITDMYPPDSDIQNAYVMGNFDEIGDVSLLELKPFIISETENLQDVAPATGWKWLDEEE